MKQLCNILISAYLLTFAFSARAQYSFTPTALGPYIQNFDGMGTGSATFSNGSNATTLPGIIVGYAVNATTFGPLPSPIVANDGLITSTSAYNFGTTGATDRALGGIAGGLNGNSGIGYICVRLRNTSGVTIKNLDVRYAIEQWFNSSLSSDAYFLASYRVYPNTSSYLSNDLVQANGVNGWTAVPQLDLQAPATDAQPGRCDGNSATYRRTAQHRLVGINLLNNTEIVIRFAYLFNGSTNGNGISLDDIAIYPETNVLYSKTTGHLNTSAVNGSAVWGQNLNGSNPPASINFSTPNCTYYVMGNNSGSSRLNSSWSVTGANSRVVIGTDASPATLYLASNDAMTATVDVANGSTLQLDGTPAGLTLGALDIGSSVQYLGNTAGTPQAVRPATYANLSCSGTSPKDLAGPIVVASSLSLTGSTAPQALRLGNNHLTMLRDASLNVSNGGQVVTNGTGEYRATVIGAGASSVAVLFPVATSTAAADYLPVSLTAGINTTGNDKDETYRVRAATGLFKSYTSAGVGSTPITNVGNVNCTWHISHETTTPVSATLKLGWSSSKEGADFVREKGFVDHYSTALNMWERFATTVGSFADHGQWGVQRSKVTSFSPFAVSSNSAGVLPVELTAFGAKRSGAAVTCSWSTASEKNSAHFIVERSLNGETFQALGKVAGQGTSTAAHSYSWRDEQPAAGTAYYRLRQVDTDGTTAFSPVVAVAGGAAAPATISVVPNPSSGHFELWTNFGTATQAQGVVMNALGKPVLTLREQLPAGPAQLSLDLSAQPAGVYVLRLQGPDGPLTLRLLKQ
jgi:hypothetical protein